ncbi:T-lymphocyte surface antigen Ly-9-like [Enoplosus armatus]|uniref:T-lymphocyte surface antigen Ly-9-like n=1 Tax=Enoplosus armatus TaxID=215367 RepID=UPI003995F181
MESQMRVILLFAVMISSAADEEKTTLTGTEGGSVTLPDPVFERGFLSSGGNIIAMVTDRNVEVLEDIYKDRLVWNKDTGLFTFTGLQRNDSGTYDVNSKKGNPFIKSYKVTVYEPLPTPAVSTLSVSAVSCILLCLVEGAEETTLLWYKGEELVNRSSSARSLPLEVHRLDFNSSYRCVAANPAEEKARPVDVTTLCRGQTGSDSRGDADARHRLIIIAVSLVFAVFVLVATIIIIIMKWKCLDKNTRIATQTDVQYTDVHISEHRHSQGGNVPDSSGNVDRSTLTTLYDKLEAHRMAPSHTDTHVYDQTMDFPHA